MEAGVVEHGLPAGGARAGFGGGGRSTGLELVEELDGGAIVVNEGKVGEAIAIEVHGGEGTGVPVELDDFGAGERDGRCDGARGRREQQDASEHGDEGPRGRAGPDQRKGAQDVQRAAHGLGLAMRATLKMLLESLVR